MAITLKSTSTSENPLPSDQSSDVSRTETHDSGRSITYSNQGFSASSPSRSRSESTPNLQTKSTPDNNTQIPKDTTRSRRKSAPGP